MVINNIICTTFGHGFKGEKSGTLIFWYQENNRGSKENEGL